MLKQIRINDYLLFFMTTLLVNAGNYGLNLFLGRYLGPEYFAEANVLTTLVLMISFIGVAFQLTAAKFVAQNKEDHEKLVNGLIHISRRVGLILAVVLLMLSPVLYSYLKFQSIIPLILLFTGLPFYIVMSTGRGILQGKSAFRKLGMTYLSEMVGRLIVTTALVLTISHHAAELLSHAVAIGFAVSFILSYWSAGIKKTRSTSNSKLVPKGVVSFFIVILIYELCQIFINNSDVILVKHFFSNEQAGMYSALALIGRVVFFATWIMVTLLFPKVIELKKAGKNTSRILLLSLGGVMTIAILIVLVCAWQGPYIISLLFGEAYSGIGSVLWMYALATSLFSCANVFVYYYLSLGHYIPVALAFMAGIFQVLGIYWFHQSLVQVIEIQVAVTAGLFVCLCIGHFGRHWLFQAGASLGHLFFPKKLLKSYL